ncbi:MULTISPECIES: PqqD family protein [unclassified Rathayibacter]|uniref:PqqD family protein n=1 Tax=unclassified Rathayibacter TaxID=2609250 RepID=UPI0015E2304D|nr:MULTISPECIES: PqqD family protein [unclassified Rathayibacter]
MTTVDPGALDHAVWARSDQLAFVEDDAQAVLLNLLSPFPVPLVLKGTAHAIWRRLEHPSTTVEILAGLADEFGVPREVLEEDVLSFLLELSTADVVHRLPSR